MGKLSSGIGSFGDTLFDPFNKHGSSEGNWGKNINSGFGSHSKCFAVCM